MVLEGRRRTFDRKNILVAVAAIAGIFICTVASAKTLEQRTRTGTVTGVIGIKGVGPMMGGTVFFFNAAYGPPPMPDRYWRVPETSYQVGQNAQFSAILPPGTYYMAAIERLSEGDTSSGPPREGDYLFVYKDRKGKPRKVTVREGRITKLGYLEIAEQFKIEMPAGTGITAIEGVLRNEEGAPVEGMHVFASEKKSLTGKALFVSGRSEKDGTYQLRLPIGGGYYLRAGTSVGGYPAPDKLVGIYGKGKPVSIKRGNILKMIDIVVSTTGTTGQQR